MTTQSARDAGADLDASTLLRRLERERQARVETEHIAEEATARLYATIRDLEQYERALEILADPVALLDDRGRLGYLNAAGRRLFFGDQALGESLAELDVASRYPAWSQSLIQREVLPMARERGEWRGEIAMTRHDGIEIQVQHDIAAYEAEDGTFLAASLRDLSESKAIETELRAAAFVDPVTGLPNRNAALQSIGAAQQSAIGSTASTTTSVIHVGLDGYGEVATTYGHDVGDRLLVTMAERLLGTVRGSHLVATVGPGIFAIVARVDGDAAETLAALLVAEVTRPVWLLGRQMLIRASAGVATSRLSSSTAEGLLRDADVAAERARSLGPSEVCRYDPSLRLTRLSQLEIEQELHQAIERHEIEAYFQPIVDLETGAVRGHEALMRWQHPQRGLVGPDVFIPIAEANGLIIDLGAWIAEAAADQICDWNTERAEDPLSLSVNLSPLQFESPELLDCLGRLRARVDGATRLQVEITETAAMGDLTMSIARIEQIQALGITVAIDDFGTGYSSFAYLKDLGADVLKIDRAFVAELTAGSTEEAIAAAIVQLAKALSMSIVAEGVETESQRAVLQDLGVETAQGFLFSPPRPASAFTRVGDLG